MKRFLLVLAVVLGLSVGAKAQGSFGVRLSYELSCPGDVKINDMLKTNMFGNSSGFSAGVVYNIPVFFGFYFEPGVSLYYNTFSLNKGLVNDFIQDEMQSPNVTVSDASVRMWGLRVPVIGGYRLNILPALSLSVFTGPEFGIALKGKSHMKVGSLSMSEGVYGDDGAMNRPDIKWRFGVGATFANHLYGAISGAVGLCDQMKEDASMHANLFDITVGYNF